MAYNGWTNWETFNVGAVLLNVETLYETSVAYAELSSDVGDLERRLSEAFKQKPLFEMSDEEWNQVDWEEVAGAFSDHIETEEEDDDD